MPLTINFKFQRRSNPHKLLLCFYHSKNICSLQCFEHYNMFNLVKEEDMHGLFCVMGFMFGDKHVKTILDFEIKLFGHYFFAF